MVAVTENGKLLARKKQIEVGELYGNNLEVKGGHAFLDSISNPAQLDLIITRL